MAKINFKSNSKITKRGVALLLALLVIGAAVYLNYLFFYDPGVTDTEEPASNNQEGETPVSTSDSYFTATELSRQMARDEALTVLESVLNNEDALESAKTQALEEMQRIASEIDTESRIEALVCAKGFDQCLAVLSKDKASIVVKSEGDLMANQLTQINEIVYSESGILPANIKIIKK